MILSKFIRFVWFFPWKCYKYRVYIYEMKHLNPIRMKEQSQQGILRTNSLYYIDLNKIKINKKTKHE